MENLVIATEKKLNLNEFVSQVKVVSNSEPKKVIANNLKCVVSSCECVGGFVTISGKIVASIVFENTDGFVDVAEGVCDFVEKQKVDFVLADTFAECVVTVKDIGVFGNEINCYASCSAIISGIYNYEMPIISNEQSDFVVNKISCDSLKHIVSANDDFAVAEEVDSTMTDIQVLSANAKVLLNEISCTVDKVVLEGKVTVETIYKNDGQIGQINRDFDFKQEIFAENVTPNMIASARTAVTSVNVTPEQNGEKYSLVYAVNIIAKCHVFEDVTYEFASDIFSLKNDLQVTYDYYEAACLNETKADNFALQSQTDVSQIIDFEDVIAVSNAQIKIDSIEKFEDKTLAHYYVTADALCLTKDSYEQKLVETDGVFEIFAAENNVFEIKPAISVSSFKVKAGKSLEVNFKVDYFAFTGKQISAKFIKSYEEKGAKCENFYGIKVYVSKENQTIFDVAKALNVLPETIASQNQVDDVFEKGQKIYVYSPANLL